MFLGLVGFSVLAAIVRWHMKLSQAIEPRDNVRVLRRHYPSITMIRPVRGKDVGAEDNFRAALDTGYPGEVETLFVFDDDQDPGLPVARAVVAEHIAKRRRGRADVIIAGSPPPGMTGKLNAMRVGQNRARGELIAFGDSDTRPDKHVLREVVDMLLASTKNGSAFAPIQIYQPHQGAGDVMYALMQNGLYAPLAAYAAGDNRELPFIMGQIMVFRREALRTIGGVESVKGQLVDDMAIGKRIHEAGYKNVMTRHPLHIATGGLSLRQFLPTYGRWMYFSRNGLPISFVWRQWMQGVGFFAAFFALLASLLTGHFLTALLPLSAIVAQAASVLALQRKSGGAPVPAKWWIMPVVFYLVSPYVLLKNALKKRVNWRGRVYALAANAALSAQAAPATETFATPHAA
jgi:ceramide glucosyltransferase